MHSRCEGTSRSYTQYEQREQEEIKRGKGKMRQEISTSGNGQFLLLFHLSRTLSRISSSLRTFFLRFILLQERYAHIYIYIFLSEYYSVLQIIFLFLYHADTIYEHEGASRQKISNSATIKAGGKTAGTRRTRALRQGFVSPPQCISYWTIALGSSFKWASFLSSSTLSKNLHQLINSQTPN